MADATPKSYHTDPQLYLYTSLTSGSSQIVTATSRLQTILKANKIQFQALDVATDEKARMLWGRRAGKRKLPGLVRYGMIIGDLEQIEEWNEYGELKENVAESKPAAKATTSAAVTPSKPPPAPAPPSASSPSPVATSTKAPAEETKTPTTESDPPKTDPQVSLAAAMRTIGFEAAKQAGDKKAQARKDVLEATKAKDPELKKLDNSAAEGLPPPTGTTEAAEAQKPETGTSSAKSKADEAPATSMSDPRAEKAEEKAAEEAKGKAPATSLGGDSASDKANVRDLPTSDEVQKKANEAIADDEEEVLEGLGQADDPKKVEIPTAKEIEAAANQAIVEDKKSHVQIKGGGTVPSPLSPSLKKQEKPDNVPETTLEKDDKSADATVSEVEDGDEEKTETATWQEANVSASTPAAQHGGQQDVTAKQPEGKIDAVTPAGEAQEQEPSRSSQRQEVKPEEVEAKSPPNKESATTKGVLPLTTTDHDKSKPAVSSTSTSKPAPSPKEGVIPLTDTASKTDSPSTGEATETKPSPATTKAGAKSDESHTGLKDSTAAATGVSQALPGSKTQSQPAAAGNKVGESVDD